MKFLSTGDWHLRLSPPRYRIDNYKETILSKFAEIKEIAIANDCEFIICPGDIFDSPWVSGATLEFVTSIVTSLELPVYATAGNHDIYSYSITTYKKTALRFLEDACPNLKVWNKELPVYHKGLIMSFREYSEDIDTSGEGYKSGFEDVNIHVVHGMLLEKKPPFEDYTLIEDCNTDAKLVIF